MRPDKQERNPRDFWKTPVYLLVGLAFLGWLFPWNKVDWKKLERETWVHASEVNKACQKYTEIMDAADKKGGDYSPEDFYKDRYILIPLRDSLNRVISVKGKFDYSVNPAALSQMFGGAVEGLYQRALDNFPYHSVKLSREQTTKNHQRWCLAERDAPIPKGYEPPLEKVSFKDGLKFCISFGRWAVSVYLKFLPFALILILFHLWRRHQSIWQELVLRPRFFFFNILKGPVGVVIYSGIDPAFEWRLANARFRYMQKTGKHYLSDIEEKALWLQAKEPLLTPEQALERVKGMPEILIRRSGVAVAVSYLLMVMSAPVMAVSGGFNQKPPEQAVQVSTDESREGFALVREKPSHQIVRAEAILDERPELPWVTRLMVRVEPEKRLTNRWVGRRWFLPPSLAPPLSRR